MLEPLPSELALDDEPLDDEQIDSALAELAGLAAAHDEVRAVVEQREDVAPVVRWAITDDGLAEWAMRKLAAINRRTAELERQRDEWAMRIRYWFEHATGALGRRAEFFAGHLERYALDQRKITGEMTLRLPSGNVATRKVPPKVVVSDEAAFRAWALANLDHPAVRVKPELVAGETGLGDDKPVRVIPVVKDRAELTLECGHSVSIVATQEDLDRLWLKRGYEGQRFGATGAFPPHPCPSCATLQVVDEAVVQEVHSFVVAADGEVVEWASVEPAGVTAKAKPS